MRQNNLWLVALLIIACLQLSACAQILASPTNGADETSSAPAKVEPSGQVGISRVILTAEAAKRIGIETAPVTTMQVHGTQREVVPYSAIIYDLHGQSWVYTNPMPLTFVRAGISVDSINGDLVLLLAGPPLGTMVVTVGATELYGTEFEPTQQYAQVGVPLVGVTESNGTKFEGGLRL
jgi:hypothetical protein